MTIPQDKTQDDLTAVSIALGAKHGQLAHKIRESILAGNEQETIALQRRLDIINQAIDTLSELHPDPRIPRSDGGPQ